MGTDENFMRKQGKIIPFIQDGQYFFKKGVKAFQQRDFKKAKHYLERAVRLDEEEPTYLCQLAIVRAELGDYQASNEMLERVIVELEPDMTDCYYFMANNYAYLGLFQESRRRVEKYLEEAPDGEYAEDAHELLQLLQLEDSLDDDTEESLHAEEMLILRHEQAKDLLEQGELGEAVIVLSKIIEDYPDFWAAYNNLALAYFYKGLAAEAVQLTEEVLEKNEGNLHALCNMAVFCHYLGDNVKAKHYQIQLERVYPIESEHRSKLGTTLALLGSYEQAYRWLRSLDKQGFSGDSSFFYWLAISAYQIGNERFAEHAWEELVKLEPNKKGKMPWKDIETNTSEQIYDDFYKVLYEAESYAAKFFALFALYQNGKKTAVNMIEDFMLQDDADHLLQAFSSVLLKREKHIQSFTSLEEKNMITGVEVAQSLFQLIQEDLHTVHVQELYMMWFTVFANALQEKVALTNPKAWTAAVEYLWNKELESGQSQAEIAKNHQISVSTLSKYVKTVKALMK